MTDKSEMPAAASIIAQYLGHISHVHYSASWIRDIEHSIWEHVIGPDPKPEEDGCFWNGVGNDLVHLRKLAAECKGWVCFNDHATGPDDFRSFVPMEDWIKQHASHTGKEMTEEQRQIFERFMGGSEQILKVKREKLLEHVAAVVLAIQASGRVEVHQDMIEIMQMIPEELRCCVECGTHPGGIHHPKCKLSCCVGCGSPPGVHHPECNLSMENAFTEKVPWT